MREIRFRAINTWFGDSKMEYFDLENAGDYIRMKENSRPNERWEVMQYTGLKDKNGKEIYQGDILKVDADKEGYGDTSYGGYLEVMELTCGFALRMFNPTTEEMNAKGQPWDSSSLWHIDDDEGKNIEVIGNIYENPELLK